MGALGFCNEDSGDVDRHLDAGPWPPANRIAALGDCDFARPVWRQGWLVDFDDGWRRPRLGAARRHDGGQQQYRDWFGDGLALDVLFAGRFQPTLDQAWLDLQHDIQCFRYLGHPVARRIARAVGCCADARPEEQPCDPNDAGAGRPCCLGRRIHARFLVEPDEYHRWLQCRRLCHVAAVDLADALEFGH